MKMNELNLKKLLCILMFDHKKTKQKGKPYINSLLNFVMNLGIELLLLLVLLLVLVSLIILVILVMVYQNSGVFTKTLLSSYLSLLISIL